MTQMPPPPDFQQPPGNTAADALQKVNAPAIALLVTAGVGAGLQVIALILNILGVGLGAAEGSDEGAIVMIQGGVGVLQSIIGIIIAIVIWMGASKMRQLRSHGFAITASILAMIPCISPCCIIGLPFGIWALVVLLKPEVKQAFTT